MTNKFVFNTQRNNHFFVYNRSNFPFIFSYFANVFSSTTGDQKIMCTLFRPDIFV